MKPASIKATIATVIATILVLFLFSVAVGEAAEPGDVGCATVEFEWAGDNTPLLTSWVVDEGVNVSTVGHFLWIQFAYEPSSTVNVLSLDLTGKEQPLTVCTDYIAEGAIPNGVDNPDHEGDYAKVIEVAPAVYAVASTVEPHPTVIDAWIVNGGFVAK